MLDTRPTVFFKSELWGCNLKQKIEENRNVRIPCKGECVQSEFTTLRIYYMPPFFFWSDCVLENVLFLHVTPLEKCLCLKDTLASVNRLIKICTYLKLAFNFQYWRETLFIREKNKGTRKPVMLIVYKTLLNKIQINLIEFNLILERFFCPLSQLQ